jgi:hypothetical protein
VVVELYEEEVYGEESVSWVLLLRLELGMLDME